MCFIRVVTVLNYGAWQQREIGRAILQMKAFEWNKRKGIDVSTIRVETRGGLRKLKCNNILINLHFVLYYSEGHFNFFQYVDIIHRFKHILRLVLNICSAEGASYVLKVASKGCHQLDVMTVLPKRSKNFRIQVIIIIFKSSTKLT